MASPRLDGLDRNYLINGGFDYFQYGLAVGSSATKAYIAPDRFLVSRQGSWFVSPIFSRYDGDAPSTKTRYVLRTYNSEAGDSLAYEDIEQRIESCFAKDLAGKPVSFSMKYKFQSYQKIKLELFYANTRDVFSAKTLIYSEEQVVTNDFSWREFKVENKVMPTQAQNGISVVVTFSNPSIVGIGNPYESRVGELKLNIGTKAQSFSYFARDVDEEFLKCERYLEKSWARDTPIGTATDAGIQGIQGFELENARDYKWTVAYNTVKRAVSIITPYDSLGNASRITYVDQSTNRTNNYASYGVLGQSEKYLTISIGAQPASCTGFLHHWVANSEL